MDPTELAFAGIARQAKLLRAREISSRELTELYLERIERLEPKLNAFRVVLGERAVAEAEEADRRLAASEEGPLLGVPIALKDGVDLAGEVSTHGTASFDEPAIEDAEMVRRLRDAGAVMIGKTNLPELAIYGFTESEAWGVTRNPWDLERTPGGSSGGSAAAVAAGLVGAASASDGAGSIRVPAANCALFGLKPQRGRVSLSPDHYVIDGEHWYGLSVNGAHTRRVVDTALYLDVTTGSGPGDPPPPPRPSRSFVDSAATPPAPLRIAVSTKPPRILGRPQLDDQVRAAVEETAELVRGLGHEVSEAHPDFGSVGNRVIARYLGGIRTDIELTPHPERLERRTHGFSRLAALSGRRRAVRKAVAGEARDAQRILAIFDRFDVLLMPTTGTPPVEVGRWDGRGALRTLLGMSAVYPYCAIWNHLGNPAAAVPAGWTDEGLPLSVQLVAPPNREELLLSLAAQLEAERPWADRRPPVS